MQTQLEVICRIVLRVLAGNSELQLDVADFDIRFMGKIFVEVRMVSSWALTFQKIAMECCRFWNQIQGRILVERGLILSFHSLQAEQSKTLFRGCRSENGNCKWQRFGDAACESTKLMNSITSCYIRAVEASRVCNNKRDQGRQNGRLLIEFNYTL